MLEKKVKIRCTCKTVNRIPYKETSFRKDKDGKIVCWQCCKKLNWGNNFCNGCSDNSLCAGSFKSKFVEFIGTITGT